MVVKLALFILWMVNLIKFIIFLCVGAVLLYGALYLQENIDHAFRGDEEEMTQTPPVDMPNDSLLPLPAEVTLTNAEGKPIEVVLLARDQDYIQFERRSDKNYFFYGQNCTKG